jgi:hypothetical protein
VTAVELAESDARAADRAVALQRIIGVRGRRS